MHRTVSCRLDAEIFGTADLTLSLAPASSAVTETEALAVSVAGVPVPVHEVADEHGGRLHRVEAAGPGRLDVVYEATVVGRADPLPVTEIDRIRYTRPSRYCEGDRLGAFARGEFGQLDGLALLQAVSSWVGSRVAYIAGSSRPTDGAVSTLLARQGVCRDFAHLVIALLRACDTPARLASVYAPGLMPMDFHAVAEACIDGEWLATDATGLAPRGTLLRIATGRDAADTAFLTVAGDPVVMGGLEVVAYSDGDLPGDDHASPAQLG